MVNYLFNSLNSFYIAQGSTASMGLFDKKAHKEEPEIRKKRKNTATYFGSAKDENKRDLGKITCYL